MEKLKEKEDFLVYKPSDKFQRFLESVDGDDLKKFLKELVIYSESNYSEVAKRVNWLLNRIKPDIAELVPTGSLVGDDGNWRFYLSGNNLTVQRKESGAWVTKWSFESS